MELIIGQTHRNVLAFASARSYFFLRDRPLLKKLSFLRISRFHATTSSNSQAELENGPLTLSNLESKHEAKSSRKGKNFELGNKKFRVKITSGNTDALRDTLSKTAGLKKAVEIAGLENGPLPLSNLESKHEAKSSWKGKNFELGNKKFRVKITSGNTDAVRDTLSKTAGLKKAVEIAGAPFSANSFSDLGLSPLLIDRLKKEGLITPTDIQSAAIPTIAQDHDIVIQSYTGSGKTLAYLLPILSKVGPLKKSAEAEKSDQKPGIEAVIVAPSRELGMQIVREAEKILGPADKKVVQQLVGGANRSRQEEALKKNKPIIVVGTPGRIAEISAAGKLHTHNCRFLVLDEVDHLLSFNYREDMHRILEHVGRKASAQPGGGVLGPLVRQTGRQTIMVSATVPFSVTRAASIWGRHPLLVRAKTVVPLASVSIPGPVGSSTSHAASSSGSTNQAAVDSLPPSLKHYYCVTKGQHKVDTLRRCIHALDAKAVIVFMNHTKPLKDVVFKLESRGVKVDEMHGDLGKLARSTIMKKFKAGELRVLVTNELSARGLDVPECDLVVNLELPTDSIHYAHRAGRTGRLGREGSVVTICEGSEAFVVRKLRKQLGVPIQACEFTEGKLSISNEEDE